MPPSEAPPVLNRVYVGDVRAFAAALAPQSVHAIVTSVPYWGLRDYGIPPSVWGGEPGCAHAWGPSERSPWANELPGPNGRRKNTIGSRRRSRTAGRWCARCGAWEGCLGLEPTVERYVEHLVAVFRALRPALRDDGALWLNLGDSYSSAPVGRYSGGGAAVQGRDLSGHLSKRSTVGPNLTDALQRLMECRPLILGDAPTIRVTAKRGHVPLQDNGFPQGVLLSLLGIERVTIKQRDQHFCQVFHTLNSPSYCRVSAPVAWAKVDGADLEIVLDAVDGVSIVIADHDAERQAVLGISRVAPTGAGPDGNRPLTVEESAKPITECIRDGQPIGNAVTFDAPLERFPDVYLVDQAIPLRDRLDPRSSGRSNFRVTQAGRQQITLALGQSGVKICCAGVSHLYAPNDFGSLVRYSELYDKASRTTNAQRSKQLLGVPWLVARALQEDGWILRSDCVWHKPNPMPESIRDRPTKAHEYLFLLSKSPRYYYNARAIHEPVTGNAHRRGRGVNPKARAADAASGTGPRAKQNPSFSAACGELVASRNRRSVWTVATVPFRGRHYATFPPELVRPCVLATVLPHGVVCDPFIGSGTVAQVAVEEGRQWIGCDLDPRAPGWVRERLANRQTRLLTAEEVGHAAD